ncbi:hypothetical protein [robinz microvirus RP_44]|nr:hypothetical protein [robinz microvirus RP_44]
MAQEPHSSTDVYRTTDKYNRFSEDNKEILNPTPMQPPLGYKAAPSLVEQIRQQVRQFKHLEDTEPETEEEADDFEIDDDPQPVSRWENDMIPSIKETRARLRTLLEQEKLYAKPPTQGANVADDVKDTSLPPKGDT